MPLRKYKETKIPCTTCEMQKCLSQFDLLYYVPLRNAMDSKISVVDMICDAVCNDCQEEVERTKRLLSNRNIRCLIVLDGVDEWPNPPGYTELPTTRGLSIKCVLLWTMRPWKLVHLQLKPKHNERIVTVCGLTQYSVAKVIEKILVRFYGLQGETLKLRYLAYWKRATDRTLEGIMRMPMMLIAACHLWHREDESSPKSSLDIKLPFSVTHLYLELLDQMIQNASRKQSKHSSFIQNSLTSRVSDEIMIPSANQIPPDIFKEFPFIYHGIDMLRPFCKLAYTDLMSTETKLVFHKGQLERQLGKSQVELAHALGLISQAKIRGKYPQPNVSVSFYHKSVQELLAAMYMTCGPLDTVASFGDYCSTLEKVMETANITKFLVGLHPILGCSLCEHFTKIVNSDPVITEYRRTLGDDHRDRVGQLYRTQCRWYRELTHSQTLTNDTSPPPTLHVSDTYLDDGSDVDAYPLPTLHISDIYLDYHTDSDTVGLTEELISHNLSSIVSVSLLAVRHTLHKVIECLQQCPNLSALRITYMPNKENRAHIVPVIPRLKRLHTIRFNGEFDVVNEDWHEKGVTAILSLKQLRYVQLEYVSLGKEGMVLTANLSRLKTIVLRTVDMSAWSWEMFVYSLLTVPHHVDVTLHGTNIDTDTVRRIQTSSHFIGAGDYDRLYFKFTTIPCVETEYDWERRGRKGKKCCIL